MLMIFLIQQIMKYGKREKSLKMPKIIDAMLTSYLDI